MNQERFEQDYAYFRGRCEALGIDPDAPVERQAPEAGDDLLLVYEEPIEACCDYPLENPTPHYRPPVKETKQQMAGFLTAKQQRRQFRR